MALFTPKFNIAWGSIKEIIAEKGLLPRQLGEMCEITATSPEAMIEIDEVPIVIGEEVCTIYLGISKDSEVHLVGHSGTYHVLFYENVANLDKLPPINTVIGGKNYVYFDNELKGVLEPVLVGKVDDVMGARVDFLIRGKYLDLKN